MSTELELPPPPVWVDYVTRAPHGAYPAGSSCKACRDPAANKLIFQFEDGGIVEEPGDRWYLAGFETTGFETSPVAQQIEQLLAEVAAFEILAAEDARFLASLPGV